MGKIIIAGGTGLIGSALSSELRHRGHQVLLLSRSPGQDRIVWDAFLLGEWVESLRGADAIINLCGSPISVKFSDSNLRTILQSRIEPTAVIGQAIEHLGIQPLWINASAIGFYGDRAEMDCDEQSGKGTGVLALLCADWENTCLNHTAKCPKAVVRVGIALSTQNGALPKLQSLTKAFLGGHIGAGTQYLSWIHIDDLVRLFCWIIEEQKEGIYNGTSPNPVTNREFMENLRRACHRPWSPPVPELLLRLVGATVGPDSSLLLDSIRATPKAALDQGFSFEYPSIELALQDLCNK